jgi:hypothetical protein
MDPAQIAVYGLGWMQPMAWSSGGSQRGHYFLPNYSRFTNAGYYYVTPALV